jgi:acetoacetyl-CoA synthetase
MGVIEVLVPLWQRVLQRTTINVDDNFFELGGSPRSASALFTEIAHTTGRELSPLTIYQAPTIAKLAVIFEQSALPRLEPVVQLRAGSKGSPAFLVHGLGGSVMEFFRLTRDMDSSRPILGLQVRGIDGVDEPLDRIEDMAEHYLEAIRKIEVRGPYILIGYSLGGLVVFEMARSLMRKNEKPALLVMIDSFPHLRYLPLPEQTAVLGHRMRRYVSTKLVTGRDSSVSDVAGAMPERLEFGRLFTKTMQTVSARSREAFARYRPHFYNGNVKFVKAATSWEFGGDPVRIWSGVVKELEVETVPGDHHEIMAAYAPKLAEILSRYLKGVAG